MITTPQIGGQTRTTPPSATAPTGYLATPCSSGFLVRLSLSPSVPPSLH